MMGNTALGDGSEFDAIRELVKRWGTRAVGIGDDATIIQAPRGDKLVVSIDSAVEGKHFKSDWLSAREISYRAVAAALSDLAAMAARPVGVLVALTVPTRWREHLIDLADGIADAVDVASTSIRGGNLSDGAELSITTTVIGSAFAPVARSGAQPGDRVYVTGTLGAPAVALRLLTAGRPPAAFRARFARPVPRIHEALWLADRGVTAAIDVSDGLVADLGHVAAASNCGFQLDADRIPVVEEIAVDDALVSGEEYELVVTTPNELDVSEFGRRFALPLTQIGVVTAKAAQPVVVRGARVADARGHDHFSR